MMALEKYLTHKSHVIWDWNGTLLNDLWLCHEIVHQMMTDYGMPPITEEEHRKLFRMPVRHFYHSLGFDLAKVPFETLAHDFLQKYRHEVHRCKLFEGTKELLTTLRSQGITQSVLSAARQQELDELIARFHIRSFFEYVFGLGDAFATSKLERGKELMQAWAVKAEKVILVGDMDHDVEVAGALGIDVVLLGDGHQHYENLKLIHPSVIPCRYTCR